MGLCWAGMIVALLLILNFWPRGMLMICFIGFLSFAAAAGDFSSYQSDGMLLEAGFISLFFAPPGLCPGFGASHPASRASLFLLQWEWFRIYFQSGAVKLLSGDPQWRHFTALDEYYQNGPLPTWIGWYLQHLPHWFHAGSALATLVMELGLIWMILLPRGFRIVLFYIVTIWELGVISSANYAFLNYLVLSLGILLVDDRFLLRPIPERWRSRVAGQLAPTVTRQTPPADEQSRTGPLHAIVRPQFGAFKIAFSTVMLIWIFYATTTQLLWMLWPRLHLFTKPVVALETFRVANQYGLFAVMTRGRYEIEFQGSNDGQNWTAYPFRYKPQALNETLSSGVN